jgi:hypothetical protein
MNGSGEDRNRPDVSPGDVSGTCILAFLCICICIYVFLCICMCVYVRVYIHI